MARKFFVPAAPGLGVNVNPPAGTLALTGQVPSVRFPPSIPTGLGANALTNTTIGLSWNPSTDVGGPGLQDYRIYRNGVVVGTTAPQSPLVQYTDTGLTPATTYTYTVTARDLNSVESAQSSPAAAQTQGGGSSVTLVHGQNFVFTGTNLVNNVNGPSTTNAPVWDRGQDGVGNVNSSWSYAYPIGNPTGFNLQNVASGVQISGTTINTPFSRVTNFLAGCAYNRVNGAQNGAPEITAQLNTIPGYPYGSYWGYWTREDPNWNYTLAPDGTHDCQRKFFVYTEGNFAPLGGSPEYAFAINSNNAIGGQQDNTSTSCECNFDVGSNIFLQIPDVNGHNGFWSGLNNRSNPATGWIFVEYSIKWSKGTDGFIKMYENGVLKVNYAGPTAQGFYPQANEAVGLPYTRMYGTAGAPATTNVVYFANTKYFNSLGGTASTGRIYLCNNATFASATVRVPALPVGGTSSTSTVTIDGGPLPAGSQVWAFFVDEVTNTTQALMTATTFTIQDPVNFNFFISPTGSDANTGTDVNHPWALTALNTKRATYAGKKVGLIGGTYSCLTIVGGTYSGTFDTPAFNIAGGTSVSPTFIGSCNSSGAYTPRAAILDGGMSLGNSSANPGGQPLIGSIGSQSAWLTLDGLEIKNSYNRAISLGFQTGVAQPTTYTQGIIVQNCSIHDAVNNASQNAGANAALVTIYSSDGAIVQNNKIFNASSTDGRASGVEIWTSKNCVSQFNTVTNIGCNTNGSGIGHKNSFQFSNTVAFNHIDLSMNGSLYQGCVCVDEDGVATTTNTINNNVLIGNCWIGASIANSSAVPKRKYFNNTCVSPSGQSTGGVITQPINAGQMTFYNNILARTGATGARGDMNANTSSFALLDYNLYPTAMRLGATPNGTNNDPSSLATSISAWVAQLTSPPAGTEAHSITGTPVFVGGTPTLPAQAYQLQTGSPGQGTGSTTGTTGGTATDMGAWGNGATQVGSSF